jgi:hypothetical protein
MQLARERHARRLELLNQRHEAARAVAAELLPAEREVDSAIVRNARLAIAVVEGRRKCKLPLCAGQEGLNFIANATVRLVEARELLAQAHVAFRSTQDEIGLQAFSYGDVSECPPSTAEAAPGHLSVVA